MRSPDPCRLGGFAGTQAFLAVARAETSTDDDAVARTQEERAGTAWSCTEQASPV
jgi:hypothetical protein